MGPIVNLQNKKQIYSYFEILFRLSYEPN